MGRWPRRSHPRDPDDFAAEVRAHIEIEAARLREDGWSEADARAEARRRFGNATIAVERVYEAGRWRGIDALAQDVRFGLRLMRRSPGFTATAVLVLSLGIGVNTALFSIVNALFFTPLPIPRPGEVFYVCDVSSSGQTHCVLDRRIRELLVEAGAEDLATFTSHWNRPGRFAVGDETERLDGQWVEPNYFDVLEVRPVLGRGFLPHENGLSNTEHPMVISHHLWERRFGSDPAVLGTRVRVDADHFTIVGVMPEGFTGLTDPFGPAQFWVSQSWLTAFGRPMRFSMGTVGRVKPGVTVEEFRAFVTSQTPAIKQFLWDQLGPEHQPRFRESHQRRRFPVVRASDTRMPFSPDVELVPKPVLVGLTTVVSLVLLIATANIAGLLLARGVTRTGEVAVRRALGAGAGRLGRQLVTEAVLLALFAAALALVVAQNLLWLFAALTPSRFAIDVPLDWRVLGFALVVCLGTGLLVGLAPALQAAKLNVLEALGAGIVGARESRGRIRRWIVVPQIGFSIVLLLVAGVHVRSLLRIEQVDPGYRTDDTLLLSVGRWEPTTPMGRPNWREAQDREAAAMRLFNRRMLEAVTGLPQVQHAGITVSLPLSLRPMSAGLELPAVLTHEAYLAGSAADSAARSVNVSPEFFDAIGMRVLRGRTFDDRDVLYGKRVALVNESLARRLWPSGDAIGRSLAQIPGNSNQQIEWHEVIGIVNDVRPVLSSAGSGTNDAVPTMYTSVLQQWRGYAPWLVVSGAGDRAALIRDVKRAVVSSDTFAEVTSVQTLAQAAGEILYPRRLAAGTLAAAGLIGLALASVGLYGLVSFSVSQRLRELGIRATLGATRGDIVSLVLREGFVVAVLGAIAGFGLAMVALRMTVGLIPGLPLVDGLAFTLVPMILALVVLAACYLPARRAARVDPVQVLRM
jgi:predicted permease